MAEPTLVISHPMTAPQREFMLSPSRFTTLSGGYGSGKSWALRLKSLYRACQNPGMPGMIVASDYGRLSRDVLPGFFELCDEHEISREWLRQPMPGLPARALLLGQGWLDSIVYFGSMDAPEAIKGANLAWITCEEITLFPRNLPGKDEPTWGVLISRLRIPGATNTIDGSGTPEGKNSWTCDPGRFETAPDSPEQVAAWLRDYRVIRAGTASNPFVADTYMADLRNTLDPIQQREKIDGMPAAGGGGQCYYAFDRARNVRRVRYSRLCGEIVIAQDYNVDPACALLCQFARGFLFVFDEVVLPNSNTPAMARELARRVKALGSRPDECVVFPDAAGRARQTSGTSDHAIMRQHGFTRLRFNRSGNPPVIDRVNSVNGALYHGRVLIDPSCVTIIRDLSQVASGPDGCPIKTTRALTHTSDALGYVVMRLLPIRRLTQQEVA